MMFFGLLLAGFGVAAIPGSMDSGGSDAGSTDAADTEETDAQDSDNSATHENDGTETLLIYGEETSLHYGSEGADTLDGDTGNDILVGYDGDDSLRGGAGNDIIHGFSGNDFISGGDGDDLLIGSSGIDTIKGNDGDDFIDGTALFTSAEFLDALDNLDSYSGRLPLEFGVAPVSENGDVIKGGEGDDTIRVGTDDTVSGNDGNDVFFAAGWITPDSPAIITDFDADEDVLLYQHYHTGPEEAEITIRESGNGHATLVVDGKAIVSLRGAAGTIQVEDVILVT